MSDEPSKAAPDLAREVELLREGVKILEYLVHTPETFSYEQTYVVIDFLDNYRREFPKELRNDLE